MRWDIPQLKWKFPVASAVTGNFLWSFFIVLRQKRLDILLSIAVSGFQAYCQKLIPKTK